jgi:hypothetical protein
LLPASDDLDRFLGARDDVPPKTLLGEHLLKLDLFRTNSDGQGFKLDPPTLAVGADPEIIAARRL